MIFMRILWVFLWVFAVDFRLLAVGCRMSDFDLSMAGRMCAVGGVIISAGRMFVRLDNYIIRTRTTFI